MDYVVVKTVCILYRDCWLSLTIHTMQFITEVSRFGAVSVKASWQSVLKMNEIRFYLNILALFLLSCQMLYDQTLFFGKNSIAVFPQCWKDVL